MDQLYELLDQRLGPLGPHAGEKFVIHTSLAKQRVYVDSADRRAHDRPGAGERGSRLLIANQFGGPAVAYIQRAT
jgi:hypothetical protein